MLFGLETYGTKPGVIKYLIENGLVDFVVLKIYSPLMSLWLKKINKSSLKTDYSDIIDNIKEPDSDFVDEIKEHIHKKFPGLRLL